MRLGARLPRASAQVHERPESRLLRRRRAAAAEAAIVLAHEEAHCDCLGRPDDAAPAREEGWRAWDAAIRLCAQPFVSRKTRAGRLSALRNLERARRCARRRRQDVTFPAPAAGDIPKRRFWALLRCARVRFFTSQQTLDCPGDFLCAFSIRVLTLWSGRLLGARADFDRCATATSSHARRPPVDAHST